MTLLLDAVDRRLIDSWQRDFPLVERPYAAIGQALGVSEEETIQRLRRLVDAAALSRIGAVVRPNTAGASTLAALAAPARDLPDAVAAVICEPGVNHAYEREHAINLWFVVTARDRREVDEAIGRIEKRTGLSVMNLPMLRDFHIDLGFPMFDREGRRKGDGAGRFAATLDLGENDRDLLAAIESGLDLCPRPFDAVARRLQWRPPEVLRRLDRLLKGAVIVRFGLVVRHSAFGFGSNAMVVWNIADDRLCEVAGRFVSDSAVTLCYERPRRTGWPYNLFTMIHARDRATALEAVARLRRLAAPDIDHEILFSTRCFRQRGARLSAA